MAKARAGGAGGGTAVGQGLRGQSCGLGRGAARTPSGCQAAAARPDAAAWGCRGRPHRTQRKRNMQGCPVSECWASWAEATPLPPPPVSPGVRGAQGGLGGRRWSLAGCSAGRRSGRASSRSCARCGSVRSCARRGRATAGARSLVAASPVLPRQRPLPLATRPPNPPTAVLHPDAVPRACRATTSTSPACRPCPPPRLPTGERARRVLQARGACLALLLYVGVRGEDVAARTAAVSPLDGGRGIIPALHAAQACASVSTGVEEGTSRGRRGPAPKRRLHAQGKARARNGEGQWLAPARLRQPPALLVPGLLVPVPDHVMPKAHPRRNSNAALPARCATHARWGGWALLCSAEPPPAACPG
jgi:hypothetical protein